MGEQQRLEGVLEHFEGAMRQLEGAIGSLAEKVAEQSNTAGEAEALRADRAKVVAELDEVRNKANDLAEAGRQAQRRLEFAASRINEILGRNV